MSRYSKIDRRIHADAGFRSLTKPQPCGQALWWTLLTTQKLTAIPGLICASEIELAASLEWPIEGFRKAFLEVSAMGMAKADWSACLIWLPNAKKYNVPESPNVVRSWRVPWDELPESFLKLEVWRILKDFTEGMGEAFSKAFLESCPKPSVKGLPNPEPEQEQEQKPKQKPLDQPPPSSEREGAGGEVAPSAASPEQPRQRRRPPQAELLPEPPGNDGKGHRLPADWKLPPDWLAEAQRLGMSADHARREADQFRDYWISVPGKEGRKSDWLATWRNRVRMVLDRRGTNGAAGHPEPIKPKKRELSLEEKLARQGM